MKKIIMFLLSLVLLWWTYASNVEVGNPGPSSDSWVPSQDWNWWPTSGSYNIPDNCKLWYDGCNKCTVINGKIWVCTQMACLNPWTPKCLEYKKPIVCPLNMPNPIALWCKKDEKVVVVKRDENWCAIKYGCEKKLTPPCPLNMPNPIALCGKDGKMIVTERDENWCAIKYGCEKKIDVCPMVYAPVCWLKWNIKETYENKCFLKKAWAKFLYNWKCKKDIVIPKNCMIWYDGCNSCTVENWKIWICTQRECLRYGTPKCLKYKIKRISDKLRLKIDRILNKFFERLDKKYSSVEKKVAILKGLIKKFNQYAQKKPKIAYIIEYINKRLLERIMYYENDINWILNIFNQY